MLRRAFILLALFACTGLAAAADDISVVYLGADDCPYCQHWEARARGELLAELRATPASRAVHYYEVKGESLRFPIVESHYPEELRWLGRKLGPMRGVPRFVLVVNGQVAWSVIGTNDYERVFLPALRQAIARAGERA